MKTEEDELKFTLQYTSFDIKSIYIYNIYNNRIFIYLTILYLYSYGFVQDK